METNGKKASEAITMRGLKRRLLYAPTSLRLATGLAALGMLLALSLLHVPGSAAHPGQPGEAVTLNFTVTVTGGTAPTDIVLWLCVDAQTDGTGCQQMDGQLNGPFTYQLATTSGTTYHHIVIEWTDGRIPAANGKDPLPPPPTHTVCSYTDFTVDTSQPTSFACSLDFTPSTVTPSPPTSTTPLVTATDPASTAPASDANSTLVTGLQIVIGVGLVLLVILVIILIFQRLGARRR